MRIRKRSVGVLLVTFAGALLTVAFATTVHGANASAQRATASEPWDLVWITDSTGWGAASLYGRSLKADREVAVRVHDEWQGGLSAASILERLQTPGDSWSRLVRNAEVIVVFGNPEGLEIVKGGGDCITSSKPPRVVGPEAWPKYIAALKAIYKRVFEIRKGKPVILRTTTVYVPVIHTPPNSPFFPSMSWDQAGITEQCTKRWESFSWAVKKAAAAYRVGVADVYTAFNGTTHLEDPVAKGYIQSDGIHPNNKGRAVIAKTLSDLGYRQVRAPR